MAEGARQDFGVDCLTTHFVVVEEFAALRLLAFGGLDQFVIGDDVFLRHCSFVYLMQWQSLFLSNKPAQAQVVWHLAVDLFALLSEVVD